MCFMLTVEKRDVGGVHLGDCFAFLVETCHSC